MTPGEYATMQTVGRVRPAVCNSPDSVCSQTSKLTQVSGVSAPQIRTEPSEAGLAGKGGAAERVSFRRRRKRAIRSLPKHFQNHREAQRKRVRDEEEGQRNERGRAGGGTEGYEACPDDAGVYWFRRGYGGRISGRMRLTSLKWAIIN